MNDIFQQIKLEEVPDQCKGLYWRAVDTSYVSNKDVGQRKMLRFLKRRSCTGCPKCEWIFDFIHEEITSIDQSELLNNIKHDKIYTYKCLSSYNYYGYELDGIEFVEMKE